MSKTDFFGDGNSDFVFQNTDGAVALWDMSGISVIGGGLVANPGPTWDVEGTAGSTAITPGSGSFTDNLGNVYSITAAGVALVNGSPVFEADGYLQNWSTTTTFCMARMLQPAPGID